MLRLFRAVASQPGLRLSRQAVDLRRCWCPGGEPSTSLPQQQMRLMVGRASADRPPAPRTSAAQMQRTRAPLVQQQTADAQIVQNMVPKSKQNLPPRPPWTPTRELQKRKTLMKRMGHLIQVLEQEAVQNSTKAKSFPEFGPGDILEVKLAVPENRRRAATVKGICIARRNRGWRTSFTLLNHVAGGGGFERTFPLYSPTIQDVTVLGTRKVRRAKLYYLRDRKPSEYKV